MVQQTGVTNIIYVKNFVSEGCKKANEQEFLCKCVSNEIVEEDTENSLIEERKK